MSIGAAPAAPIVCQRKRRLFWVVMVSVGVVRIKNARTGAGGQAFLLKQDAADETPGIGIRELTDRNRDSERSKTLGMRGATDREVSLDRSRVEYLLARVRN
jgi:hypothetical protein